MAPRKQIKQAAAESVTAVADGNVSPPKKRKTVATKSSAVADEPKQTRRVRQTKAADKPASPAKKSRAKPKKAAAAAAVVTEAVKNNVKSKSKKPVDKAETAAVDDAVEEAEQVIGKKTRGGKSVMAKKAGTKSAAVKPKAKVSAIKKRKNEETVENGVENIENKSPAKKTTRREKAAEVSAAPTVVVVQPAKVSRKRRNAQDTKDAIVEAARDTRVTKEVEDEDEAEVAVPNKKPRGRAKKTEANDASEVVSKGKPKKSAKAVVVKPPLKETETEEQDEQNAVIQKNTSKAKVTKNAKKGKNAKKTTPKGKRNAAEKISDTQLDKAMKLQEDVNENGEAETLQISEPKQKKRNIGKAHVATNEKTELKGRQKKGQITTASTDEEDGTKNTSMKSDTTEKVSPILGTPNGSDISSDKDDVMVKEENNDKSNESMKDIETKHGAADKLERSATFLCFEKTENC